MDYEEYPDEYEESEVLSVSSDNLALLVEMMTTQKNLMNHLK